MPTQFLNATRAERSGQVGTPSAKTSTTAHEAGTQICALRAACARGAAWPPSSLFLCAATHGQALGRAAVHRVQVEDAGLLEGHLAVARLVVYLRSRPRALCQGASA